jgi:hypothetical protein
LAEIVFEYPTIDYDNQEFIPNLPSLQPLPRQYLQQAMECMNHYEYHKIGLEQAKLWLSYLDLLEHQFEQGMTRIQSIDITTLLDSQLLGKYSNSVILMYYSVYGMILLI